MSETKCKAHIPRDVSIVFKSTNRLHDPANARLMDRSLHLELKPTLTFLYRCSNRLTHAMHCCHTQLLHPVLMRFQSAVSRLSYSRRKCRIDHGCPLSTPMKSHTLASSSLDLRLNSFCRGFCEWPARRKSVVRLLIFYTKWAITLDFSAYADCFGGQRPTIRLSLHLTCTKT
jgi:hypothetical protein